MRTLPNLLLLSALLCISCSKPVQNENTDADTTAEKNIPAPPVDLSNSEDIIFSSGDVTLSMHDYDQCIAILKLKGSLSQRALANPRFQRDEIQRCYQNAFMRQYLASQNAPIKPALRQKALREAFEKNGVQSESALAEKLGIPLERLNDILDASMAANAVQETLAMAMNDQDAAQKFKVDYRKFSLEVADFDNTPTPEEAAHFVGEQEAAFSAYLTNHPEVSQTKPHAHFIRMSYPPSTDTTSDAYAAAQAMRQTAAQNGQAEALKKCTEEEAAGCKILNNSDNLHRAERTDALAWAFKMPAGTVSDIIQTDTGNEIWILQHVTPPESRDIKNPEVKEALSIQVMQALTPAPHLIESLKSEIETPNPDLKSISEAHQGHYQSFQNILYADLVDNKAITAPKILSTLSSLTPDELNLFSSPVVHDGRLYIFRVSEMTIPDDEDFKNHQNTWRQRLASDPSLSLVDNWLKNSMPNLSSINVHPIQKKYGILQPDGSIR